MLARHARAVQSRAHVAEGLCLAAAVKHCCWPHPVCFLLFNCDVYKASIDRTAGAHESSLTCAAVLHCCATGLTDLHVPSPEVTALAITHNAATELTDGLAGFLGGKACLTMRCSRVLRAVSFEREDC